MHRVRVLLAEDHETVREGLKVIVNSQPDMHVVAEASDGATAIRKAQELLPDVVVMDISMPHLNGVKAAEMLAASAPQVKLLAFTRHDEAGFVQQMMRAGAHGYVLKGAKHEEMLRAIRAVAGGPLGRAPLPKGHVQVVVELVRLLAGVQGKSIELERVDHGGCPGCGGG